MKTELLICNMYLKKTIQSVELRDGKLKMRLSKYRGYCRNDVNGQLEFHFKIGKMKAQYYSKY